jgi:hypothetical protein
MEGLGMRGGGGRDQADAFGERRHERGDEHGVEPAPHLIGALVGPRPPGRLQTEGILDRQEVEQAALGRAGQPGPVRGAEDVAGPGRWIAPRRRVEPGAVERDGEMEGDVGGQASERIAPMRRRGRPAR